ITENGDTRLVFKGLESVRSDWTQIAREFQQELYERIFKKQPWETFVRETVAAVARGECDDKLVLRRRLRRKLDEYEKNVPPHVRAARRGEEIRRSRGLAPIYSRGSWVEYVMTINGPESRAYVTSPLDYQFYIDRQLAPVADAILSFMATSLAEITDRQLGLF
ncbi:MAG: DNA polymerase domain-containing protein, partial [Pseudomonadales bacterium]